MRPLASPLPLGFLGLAGAPFVLAGLPLGWAVLPLARRGRGKRAVEDGFEGRIDGLARKPGVRAQL